MDDIQNMIDAALEQKPMDFENSFGSAMISKLHNVINDKKLEIAQTLFNSKPAEEDFDTDELEDDHEDQEQEEE